MMVLTFSHSVTGQIATIKCYSHDIEFGTLGGGTVTTGILEGIRLSPAMIIKDHPDLKGKPIEEIKREGLVRFKKHYKSFLTWEAKKNYLKKDLEGHGYKLVMQQLPGQRLRKVG